MRLTSRPLSLREEGKLVPLVPKATWLGKRKRSQKTGKSLNSSGFISWSKAGCSTLSLQRWMDVDTGATSTACWWSKAGSEWRKHGSDLPESYRLEERDKTCKLDNERGCYRLNICVSPSPKSICWNPAPPNDGASGRWLDREGEWGWMNPTWMGFALITKTPASSPSPSAMRGCSKKTQLSVNQEAGPHLTPYLPTPWSWTSQPPELWEVSFCCLYATQSVVLQQLEQTKTEAKWSQHQAQRGGMDITSRMLPKRSEKRGKMQRLLTRWGKGDVAGEGKGWVLLATQWGSVNWQEKQPLAWIPKGHHGSQISCHPDISSSPSSPIQQRRGI